MVFKIEKQLEFEFMKEEPKKPLPEKRQERYHEYILRRMREEDKKDANI